MTAQDFAARLGVTWIEPKQQKKIDRFVRLYGAIRAAEFDRIIRGEPIYGTVATLWKQWDWSVDIYTLQDARRHMKGNLDRVRNRRNGHTVEITLEHALRLCEQQNWLCAYSEQPLDFTRGGQMFKGKWCNPSSATLDRIDSSQGYVEGNVQIIEWRYNLLKSDFTVEELTEMCAQIVKRHQA